jgi:predicted nucleotidyltransferase
VTQSVVSAYESGARQPSVPTLERLISAAGFDLDLLLHPRQGSPLGSLRERVRRHRQQIERIAATHGITNVRLFGSVARGQIRPDSDIDFLVDVAPGVGILELGRCQAELETLLGAPVDIVPAADLKAGVAPEVLAEARAL